MKINPCIKCKERITANYYPEFKKYSHTHFTQEYYAECCRCTNNTEIQDSLELAVQAWNKLNTNPQQTAKDAWEDLSVGCDLFFKIEEKVLNADKMKEKIKILDEFFNTANAEFEEVEK